MTDRFEGDLPPLPDEMRAVFDAEMSHVDGGGDVPFGVEIPGLGVAMPINMKDPTPRQRFMLGILGKALREHKERQNGGEGA